MCVYMHVYAWVGRDMKLGKSRYLWHLEGYSETKTGHTYFLLPAYIAD